MINLETDSLDVLIRTQPKLMVMFGTDWCGNCDVLKPYFEKVSNQQQNRQIPFVYVNPDTSPNSRELVEYGNKEEIVDKVLSILLG
jgi:thiol-disulfide isomerase/thioredoxin